MRWRNTVSTFLLNVFTKIVSLLVLVLPLSMYVIADGKSFLVGSIVAFCSLNGFEVMRQRVHANAKPPSELPTIRVAAANTFLASGVATLVTSLALSVTAGNGCDGMVSFWSLVRIWMALIFVDTVYEFVQRQQRGWRFHSAAE